MQHVRLCFDSYAVYWLGLQAEEAEEACTNIGNLFDESVTEAADPANFQDFGAADGAELTGAIPSYHN